MYVVLGASGNTGHVVANEPSQPWEESSSRRQKCGAVAAFHVQRCGGIYQRSLKPGTLDPGVRGAVTSSCPSLDFHAVRRRIPQTAEHGSSRCSMLEKVARAIANFVRRDAEDGRNIAARHAPRFDELRIFVGHAQNLRHHAHCHIFERAYNVDSPVLLLPLIGRICGF